MHGAIQIVRSVEDDDVWGWICVDLPRPVTQPSLLAKTYKSNMKSINSDPQKKKILIIT